MKTDQKMMVQLGESTERHVHQTKDNTENLGINDSDKFVDRL